MLKIPTRHLLAVNGLLWTAIGTRIALIGIRAYGGLETVKWRYFLLSAIVFSGFYMMFTGIVRRYAGRIEAMPEARASILTLKRIPSVPRSFIAWFYSGLGPGLLSAGIRFLARWALKVRQEATHLQH